LFHRKRSCTLQVYDRYFHDLLVDPRRYRYGGSRVLARVLVRLAPPLHLAIFLDAPTEVLQRRKQEVAPQETDRQRLAYLDLAQSLGCSRVVDTTAPLNEVVAAVESIVVGRMANRVDRRYRRGN